MMLNVQTVCPNAPTTYGTPDPNGGPDNCNVPIGTALPPCSTSSTAATSKSMKMNSTEPHTRERMKKH